MRREDTSGIRYYNPNLTPQVYYAFKHREGNGLVALAGVVIHVAGGGAVEEAFVKLEDVAQVGGYAVGFEATRRFDEGVGGEPFKNITRLAQQS